jgi:hypothetical protein
MGLGSVQSSDATYLSVAGGYIWDRKKGSDDPNYAEQSYTRADKTEGVRKGARYANLLGKVSRVQFRTHDEYGENINVTFDTKEGERYIISISMNNRFSQDMMKALLNSDLDKELFMKPYDFVDKNKKRAQGISFRQNGEKISLRVELPDEFQKEKEWFQKATKKQIKRFFEDLSDYLGGEVREKVIPQLPDELPQIDENPKSGLGAAKSEESSQPADDVEEPKSEVKPVTPVKMKKAIKEYIAENYPGKELPQLSKAELGKWYKLTLDHEELPFEEDDVAQAEVSDIDEEIDKLLL